MSWEAVQETDYNKILEYIVFGGSAGTDYNKILGYIELGEEVQLSVIIQSGDTFSSTSVPKIDDLKNRSLIFLKIKLNTG